MITTDVGWMGIFSDDDGVTGWVGRQVVVIAALAMTASASVGVVVAEGISQLDRPRDADRGGPDRSDGARPEPPVVLPEQPPAPPWSPPEEEDVPPPEAGPADGGTGVVEVPREPAVPGVPESGRPGWWPDDGDDAVDPPDPVDPPDVPGGGVQLPDDFFDEVPDWVCDTMPVLCGPGAGDSGGWPGLRLEWLDDGVVRIELPHGEDIVIRLGDAGASPGTEGADEPSGDASSA